MDAVSDREGATHAALGAQSTTEITDGPDAIPRQVDGEAPLTSWTGLGNPKQAHECHGAALPRATTRQILASGTILMEAHGATYDAMEDHNLRSVPSSAPYQCNPFPPAINVGYDSHDVIMQCCELHYGLRTPLIS